MKIFSKLWNSSKSRKKQRKFRFKAPLHTKGKFLNVHLSKSLREKYSTRSLRVRTGDKVKILRGSKKGKEGKVELVSVKDSKVYITGMEVKKISGSIAKIPFEPSNLMITDLNLDDKERKSILERKGENKK